MSVNHPDPRVALELLKTNLTRLIEYFREVKEALGGFKQDERHGGPARGQRTVLDDVLYMRYYAAAEVFQTAISELERYRVIASRPFPKKRKPTGPQAAERIRQIMAEMVGRVLKLFEDEVRARMALLRSYAPDAGADELTADIAERIGAAMDAEFSQRLLALNTVATALRAVAQVFLSMFPDEAGNTG